MSDIRIYGFTGTQRGMTREQISAIRLLLTDAEITEWHHGDCIGADSESHELIRETFPGTEIVIHPPIDNRKRAFDRGDKLRPAKGYMERNEDIVDESELLIAAPSEFKEKIRSGTWATVRRARDAGKPVIIVYPDGTTNHANKRDNGQLRLL